ncbi:hypothetical protein LTR99_009442 [Exophiala xenobiotica]|uniref:Uncharacterized protein n=1 Tax=Vermiconidia calcicola TaxID=1690605 RepID=A0AAV9PZC5_9PEZI|nr:hypothetical protein LTR92_002270 [Exophiala xenobiotica]KAK5530882.1 hypothetical protein LTR25_008739 [Vermiconidia calcicola]KAK5544374.1 hypothetical protein LTR23_004462 [Chaetothyriales sp. CCFEE 6169]KAK5210361.1 hypothetical protein LTR41_004029 [Exophiala xenobiotica]KAK5228423.1 hypothetical protein LTR72_002306 [Exophiala xenobiotica]
MAFSAVGIATTVFNGPNEMVNDMVARGNEKVVAALKARGIPAVDINDIVKLVPRDTVTVTTTAACDYTVQSYGGPPITTVMMSTVFSTPTPTPDTPAVPSTPTLASTPVVPPESSSTDTVATPETPTATPETPTATPGVPATNTETTAVVTTTPEVGTDTGTPPPPETTNAVTPSDSTGVTETASSTTTETSALTFSTSSAGVTPSTSTTPPAPNANVAGTAGVHVGLGVMGLVAVLVMA